MQYDTMVPVSQDKIHNKQSMKLMRQSFLKNIKFCKNNTNILSAVFYISILNILSEFYDIFIRDSVCKAANLLLLLLLQELHLLVS